MNLIFARLISELRVALHMTTELQPIPLPCITDRMLQPSDRLA